MECQEDGLRDFGAIVARLTQGLDLSRVEARHCWRQILQETQPALQQGAFIAALKAKGETLDEIAGTFEALYEFDTLKVTLDAPGPLIDNCGTGADVLKTFNISTGAGIVPWAGDVGVVRLAAGAIFSIWGAVDVIGAFGVTVESVQEL